MTTQTHPERSQTGVKEINKFRTGLDRGRAGRPRKTQQEQGLAISPEFRAWIVEVPDRQGAGVLAISEGRFRQLRRGLGGPPGPDIMRRWYAHCASMCLRVTPWQARRVQPDGMVWRAGRLYAVPAHTAAPGQWVGICCLPDRRLRVAPIDERSAIVLEPAPEDA